MKNEMLKKSPFLFCVGHVFVSVSIYVNEIFSVSIYVNEIFENILCHVSFPKLEA